MILAAIDVGTNSAKVLVARVSGGRIEPLLLRRRITRLGTGRITPDAASRTLAALKTWRRAAERLGASAVAAVGTETLRSAENAADFVSRARDEAGVEVRVLSGDEEARLSFRGACMSAPPGRLLGVEIGGGSVQVTVGSREGASRSWSLPLGAVTMTSRFLKTDPPASGEVERLSGFVLRRIEPIRARAVEALGIGGAVHALAELIEPGAETVAARDLALLADRLAGLTVRRRMRLGLERGRADIVVAGAVALREILSRVGASRLRPSPYGLRYGLILDLASRAAR